MRIQQGITVPDALQLKCWVLESALQTGGHRAVGAVSEPRGDSECAPLRLPPPGPPPGVGKGRARLRDGAHPQVSRHHPDVAALRATVRSRGTTAQSRPVSSPDSPRSQLQSRLGSPVKPLRPLRGAAGTDTSSPRTSDDPIPSLSPTGRNARYRIEESLKRCEELGRRGQAIGEEQLAESWVPFRAVDRSDGQPAKAAVWKDEMRAASSFESNLWRILDAIQIEGPTGELPHSLRDCMFDDTTQQAAPQMGAPYARLDGDKPCRHRELLRSASVLILGLLRQLGPLGAQLSAGGLRTAKWMAQSHELWQQWCLAQRSRRAAEESAMSMHDFDAERVQHCMAPRQRTGSPAGRYASFRSARPGSPRSMLAASEETEVEADALEPDGLESPQQTTCPGCADLERWKKEITELRIEVRETSLSEKRLTRKCDKLSELLKHQANCVAHFAFRLQELVDTWYSEIMEIPELGRDILPALPVSLEDVAEEELRRSRALSEALAVVYENVTKLRETRPRPPQGFQLPRGLQELNLDALSRQAADVYAARKHMILPTTQAGIASPQMPALGGRAPSFRQRHGSGQQGTFGMSSPQSPGRAGSMRYGRSPSMRRGGGGGGGGGAGSGGGGQGGAGAGSQEDPGSPRGLETRRSILQRAPSSRPGELSRQASKRQQKRASIVSPRAAVQADGSPGPAPRRRSSGGGGGEIMQVDLGGRGDRRSLATQGSDASDAPAPETTTFGDVLLAQRRASDRAPSGAAAPAEQPTAQAAAAAATPAAPDAGGSGGPRGGGGGGGDQQAGEALQRGKSGVRAGKAAARMRAMSQREGPPEQTERQAGLAAPAGARRARSTTTLSSEAPLARQRSAIQKPGPVAKGLQDMLDRTEAKKAQWEQRRLSQERRARKEQELRFTGMGSPTDGFPDLSEQTPQPTPDIVVPGLVPGMPDLIMPEDEDAPPGLGRGGSDLGGLPRVREPASPHSSSAQGALSAGGFRGTRARGSTVRGHGPPNAAHQGQSGGEDAAVLGLPVLRQGPGQLGRQRSSTFFH